ncbi:MAG: D-alanyl-D-alanine carboxypeptidase/D-alanyl-D-alanine-endopeptidase, partial [Ignavibacteriales bacterium]|nr:D-alanyl-D-alanine carboxypeptidase/D-alanyl-D-alanine-endopeptidase [Ignavibacteriales bacterium]
SDSIFIPTKASIKIISLSNGEILFERDSKMLVRPASNMKLLTSAAALMQLGTSYNFKTRVLLDSLEADSVVHGNLYLKGFGDPDLTSADVDSLVAKLAAMRVRVINGNVVADVSYFDDEFWGTGWMWDDEPDPDAPFVSALALNDNCVSIRVKSGLKAGDTVNATANPATSYIAIRNNGTTVTDSVRQPLKVYRSIKQRSNTILIDGEMLADTNRTQEFSLTVWKPELYAATVLKEKLASAGISIHGEAVEGVAPAAAATVVEMRRPMDSVITHLNKVSDNLSAEMALKAVGTQRYGQPGSFNSGLWALRHALSSMGIDTMSIRLVDGSGLSHYNLITTELLTTVLKEMHRKPDIFPSFYNSLPIAGIDGTLRTRMKHTLAESNLRAKTGSISGVSSLSGYVTTQDGELLAFSIAMQNFVLPTPSYRLAQDRIGALLAGFSRGRIAKR